VLEADADADADAATARLVPYAPIGTGRTVVPPRMAGSALAATPVAELFGPSLALVPRGLPCASLPEALTRHRATNEVMQIVQEANANAVDIMRRAWSDVTLMLRRSEEKVAALLVARRESTMGGLDMCGL